MVTTWQSRDQKEVNEIFDNLTSHFQFLLYNKLLENKNFQILLIDKEPEGNARRPRIYCTCIRPNQMGYFSSQRTVPFGNAVFKLAFFGFLLTPTKLS